MVRKKVKSTLRGIDFEKEVQAFHREFKRRLFDFITGAFAFVAALLWRDAINKLIQSYVQTLKAGIFIVNPWLADFLVAFSVSVIAVIAIVLLSKILKSE